MTSSYSIFESSDQENRRINLEQMEELIKEINGSFGEQISRLEDLRDLIDEFYNRNHILLKKNGIKVDPEQMRMWSSIRWIQDLFIKKAKVLKSLKNKLNKFYEKCYLQQIKEDKHE